MNEPVATSGLLATHTTREMAASEETTIVVELCERLEDLATELVQKTAARIGGQAGAQLEAQCSKRVQTADLKGLVDALVGPLTNDCMTPVPPAAAGTDAPMNPEMGFSLFLVLMRRLPADMMAAVVPRAVEGLTSTKENSALRARCLSSLYSALPSNNKARYTVYKALVEYVGEKSSVTENVENISVADLCNSWGETSIEKQRALQLSIVDALKASSPASSQQALIAYLATFKTADDVAKADAARIRECALNAIRDPVSSSKDSSILNLLVVQQRLKREEPKLFELLEIVSGDSLEKYANFIAANADFGKQADIDYEKTFERMRLLALATLGSDTDRALGYDHIAQTLHINVNEVESWIIRAIAAGVVDARIDQVSQTVVIHRATQRVFTDEQWIRLSNQLKKWRASVRSVVQSVQTARDQHGAAVARLGQ